MITSLDVTAEEREILRFIMRASNKCLQRDANDAYSMLPLNSTTLLAEAITNARLANNEAVTFNAVKRRVNTVLFEMKEEGLVERTWFMFRTKMKKWEWSPRWWFKGNVMSMKYDLTLFEEWENLDGQLLEDDEQ